MYDFFVYRLRRHFDGCEVIWILERQITCGQATGKYCPMEIFETREEAEAERNRLNSKYGLDQLGI
jgi:hypothetical protein